MKAAFVNLLVEMKNSPASISPSAYDTAWIARLVDIDKQIGEQALDWLRLNQLPDGGWGAIEPFHFYDRLICTLAAMVVLAEYGRIDDHFRVQKARLAIETYLKESKLAPKSESETVGFEMIAPTLIAEAEAHGIIQSRHSAFINQFVSKRNSKIAALPTGIIDRSVSHAFSSEMVAPENIQLLDIKNLQESNGSVGCSPAATSFLLLNFGQNTKAISYLHQYAIGGAVPCIAPIDIFEATWVLWNLAITSNLKGELLVMSKPIIDFLRAKWNPNEGIALCSEITPLDGDTTSLTYDVLTRLGYPVDIQAVLYYEQDTHFRCFSWEANPSISTNIHALMALRQAKFEPGHPKVQKILQFLELSQTFFGGWFDKWHVSPYYATAHAVIATAGYAGVDFVEKAVNWILRTQRLQGDWGFYMPTAEETAYCLQALIMWKLYGGKVPNAVLKKGIAWLINHAEPPYAPLWIGKCLYCPELVVRSAVLSAIALTEESIGSSINDQ